MSSETLIGALRRVVRPELQCPQSVLVEADVGSTSGETRITNINNGLILKLASPAGCGQQNEWLFPLFQPGARRISRMCDYVVFLPRSRDGVRDARLVVLLCELKSGRTDGAIDQIRAGLLLAEYAINTVVLHCSTAMPETIEYRGVIFWNGAKTQKGGSRPRSGREFRRDTRTGLPYLSERAGLSYHVDTFCAEIDACRPHPHRWPT